ncbi:carbohydrate ABC transporter permease [Facklamia lactis]|nr:sugar ABC transporter permease [Facklamia lactis]
MIKNNWRPWFLLFPVLMIMIIFVFFPILQTFYYSLHDFKLTRPNQIEFIGLQNYREILKNKDFYHALNNSLFILVIVVCLTMVSSLFVGILLNIQTKMSGFLTAVAILPWALPPLVNGIIWSFIFHPTYGLLNKVLINFNLINKPVVWTNNTLTLLIIVSIIVAWRIVPFCALIILANLQSISTDIYEASAIDGAGKYRTFREITLPLLSPSLLVCLIQATLAGLNVFDEVIALVEYRQDAQTLLIYNYQNTFSFLEFGYGSAITYIIMIFTGIAGYFYVRNMTQSM